MRTRWIGSRQCGGLGSAGELERDRAAVVESTPLSGQSLQPRRDRGNDLEESDRGQGACVGRSGSRQRANSGLRFHQSPQLDRPILDERLSLAHERGLILDEPDLDSALDQAPEPVREAEFFLDHQMAQIMWEPAAVAREVPPGRCPVRSSDVHPITAATSSNERYLQHRGRIPHGHGARAREGAPQPSTTSETYPTMATATSCWKGRCWRRQLAGELSLPGAVVPPRTADLGLCPWPGVTSGGPGATG